MVHLQSEGSPRAHQRAHITHLFATSSAGTLTFYLLICLSDKLILKTPAFQNAPSVPQPHFTKSKERRQRYLRDRIHSLTGSEVKMAAPESTAAAVEVEGDEDDPYAWLSQTAPASPDSERHHRSRDIFT